METLNTNDLMKTQRDKINENFEELNNNAQELNNNAQELGNNVDNHINNSENPHVVTKAQVGLGNVPNVATNDQTVTHTAATTLATLTSGEKMSSAFGKIRKAISDLMSHITNNSNPHKVTAAQAGAAASSHNHSASNITSGTLSAERGGTGNANGTVNKLTTARRIDGMAFDGTANIHHYVMCDTEGYVAIKEVTLDGWSDTPGAVIYVNFLYSNTADADDVRLLINDKRYHLVYRPGTGLSHVSLPSDFIRAGAVYTFVRHDTDRLLSVNTYSFLANRLKYPRNIQTDLGSTGIASFDGTKDITPGVMGVLPIKNGGTGGSSVVDALSSLGIATSSTGRNYLKIADLLIQWGDNQATLNGSNITFPTAFSGADSYSITFSPIWEQGTPSPVLEPLIVINRTDKGFTVKSPTMSMLASWIAIGR